MAQLACLDGQQQKSSSKGNAKPSGQVGGSPVNRYTAVFSRGSSDFVKTLKLKQLLVSMASPNCFRKKKKMQSKANQGPDYAKAEERLEFLLPDKIQEIKCLILIIYLVWFKGIKISNSDLAASGNMSPQAGTLQRATRSYKTPSASTHPPTFAHLRLAWSPVETPCPFHASLLQNADHRKRQQGVFIYIESVLISHFQQLEECPSEAQ